MTRRTGFSYVPVRGHTLSPPPTDSSTAPDRGYDLSSAPIKRDRAGSIRLCMEMSWSGPALPCCYTTAGLGLGAGAGGPFVVVVVRRSPPRTVWRLAGDARLLIDFQFVVSGFNISGLCRKLPPRAGHGSSRGPTARYPGP